MILGMERGGMEGKAEIDRPSLASNVLWFVACPLCTRVSKPLRYLKTLIERDNFFSTSLSVRVKNPTAITFKN